MSNPERAVQPKAPLWRLWIKKSTAIAAAFCALAGFDGTAHADVVLRLTPEHSIINRGDTLTISVGVNAADTVATKVFGVGFELQVDPRQFEVLSLAPGVVSTRPGVLNFEHVEPLTGSAAFSMSHTFGTGALAPFEACQIVLRAYAGAEPFIAPLVLRNAAAVDRYGNTVLGYADSTFVLISGDATSVPPGGGVAGLSLSSVWPNPVKSNIGLAILRMPHALDVTTHVLDVTGRVAEASIEDRGLNAGEHLLQIDASRLTPGRYYLRVRAGSRLLVQPWVKY